MKKVLVADDEEAILALVSATLEDEEGYQLLKARDGQEALAMAREHQPTVIFLDILMPKLDGFEVCRRLKGDPTTAAIKVVFLTALTQDADFAQGNEAGGDDYFTKPFSPTALLEKVHELLGG